MTRDKSRTLLTGRKDMKSKIMKVKSGNSDYSLISRKCWGYSSEIIRQQI